jgi:hypothetical protein
MRCVIVNDDKFFRKCAKYVKNSPFFFTDRTEMQFNHDLINVVKIFKGKLFKNLPLASLAI